MAFQVHLRLNRKTVTLRGAIGLIVLLGILLVPQLLAAKLTVERAESEIRKYLRFQTGQSQMAELRASGLDVPDAHTASRWKADFDRLDRLEFVSLKVRRSLLTSPLSSSRVFVAKATLRKPDRSGETRYFSLRADSRLFDFFWVVERSRWAWFFSI